MTKYLLIAFYAYCNAYTPFLYPYNEHIPTQRKHSNSSVWKDFLCFQEISQHFRQNRHVRFYNDKQYGLILRWHREYTLRNSHYFTPHIR